MERILTPDEKIRRAEEIYYRKKMQNRGRDTARVNVSDKRNITLFQKMFLQLLICVVLYTILYLIQTTDYVFSSDVLEKAKDILSYDIDFGQIYEQFQNYIKDNSEMPQEDVGGAEGRTGSSAPTRGNY